MQLAKVSQKERCVDFFVLATFRTNGNRFLLNSQKAFVLQTNLESTLT